MAEKEPKGFLNLFTDYKHLANPFYALAHPGAAGRAPEGKYRLAKRDGTNLALWNALGVSSWLVPTSALAAYFANKWWDKKIQDAVNKSSVSRLATVRPTLTPDADLENISNIVDDPSREINMVKAMLSKSASGSGRKDDNALDEWVKNLATGAIPLAAIPVSMLASKYAVNKLYERSLKNRLKAERIAIRNNQNAIDHAIMVEQGLIKGASSEDSSNSSSGSDLLSRLTVRNPHFRERVNEFRQEKSERRGAVSSILGAPILGLLLGTGLISALAFSYLRKNDKDTGTLDFLRKKSLGHNVMQNTPEIGLEQFGVPVTDIVARPGDKKQPGYTAISETEPKALPSTGSEDVEVTKLLDNLEELKPEESVEEESKKKDALF